MPPIMIATARYKKKPEGTEFPCSASSAKALSALGLANYKTTDTPLVENRAMQAEQSNSFSKRVYVPEQSPVCEPAADASASVEVSVGSIEESPAEVVETPEVTPEVAEQETVVSAVESHDADAAIHPEKVAEKEESDPKAEPVVGSIDSKADDASVQHDSKVKKSRPKKATPTSKK